MTWRPLSLQGESDPRFDEPHEGLPSWLRGPVVGWIKESFEGVDPDDGSFFVRNNALTDLQLEMRLREPLSGGDDWRRLNDLVARVNLDQEFALDVIDWMVAHWPRFSDGGYVDERTVAEHWTADLNLKLRQGGSAWEVTSNGPVYRLTRRAVGPVVDVLEHTATDATRAHNHLASAWSKLTGRQPDPTGAYREAVRAVEAVAKPVILPNNGRATLGTMIAAMRDRPQKWTVTLGSVDDVRVQMELVWRGQTDRHGTDDEAVPENVSPEEADAAFSACLNLVRLFVGGHVAFVS